MALNVDISTYLPQGVVVAAQPGGRLPVGPEGGVELELAQAVVLAALLAQQRRQQGDHWPRAQGEGLPQRDPEPAHRGDEQTGSSK